MYMYFALSFKVIDQINKKAMLVEVVANDSCGAEAAQISQSSEVKCTYLSNIKLFL